MRNCVRCGRNIKNPSELCFECNEEWQRYMKMHPITNFFTALEELKRWEEFLKDSPSRR